MTHGLKLTSTSVRKTTRDLPGLWSSRACWKSFVAVKQSMDLCMRDIWEMAIRRVTTLLRMLILPFTLTLRSSSWNAVVTSRRGWGKDCQVSWNWRCWKTNTESHQVDPGTLRWCNPWPPWWRWCDARSDLGNMAPQGKRSLPMWGKLSSCWPWQGLG